MASWPTRLYTPVTSLRPFSPTSFPRLRPKEPTGRLPPEKRASVCGYGFHTTASSPSRRRVLGTHPKLREAALEAIRKFGVGEERIAAFKNVEACVVFQSGFAANAGTVAAILTPEDHIVSDELNHASIIDGCRLSRAKIHVFPHKDASAAEKILGELDSVPGRKLLITDGVFSMDGDIGALPGLTEAAERHGAMMMVDDAHASGVLGRNGRGPSTTSAWMDACTFRWGRSPRRSACWAGTCAGAAI